MFHTTFESLIEKVQSMSLIFISNKTHAYNVESSSFGGSDENSI
jgi:hypothetical protein